MSNVFSYLLTIAQLPDKTIAPPDAMVNASVPWPPDSEATSKDSARTEYEYIGSPKPTVY